MPGFGSKADICNAKGHVRFTPNSSRKSEFPHKVMSALPLKADMCGANRYIRYGPKADIAEAVGKQKDRNGATGCGALFVANP